MMSQDVYPNGIMNHFDGAALSRTSSDFLAELIPTDWMVAEQVDYSSFWANSPTEGQEAAANGAKMIHSRQTHGEAGHDPHPYPLSSPSGSFDTNTLVQGDSSGGENPMFLPPGLEQVQGAMDAQRKQDRRRAQNRSAQRAFRTRRENHLVYMENLLHELKERHENLLRQYSEREGEIVRLNTEIIRLSAQVSACLSSSSSSPSSSNLVG